MTDHRLVLSHLPFPLLLIGLNRQVTLASAGASSLWSSPLEGRHYATLMRQPEVVDAIEIALMGGEGRNLSVEWREATGDRFFQVWIAPVGGEVLVSFAEKTSLVLSDRMRRDFVANVSHELRTPLTALSGFIETLQGPARDDINARQRFLTIMQSETGRMVRLVRDLLELSRVEAQEREAPTEEHDLTELISSVALSLRSMAEMHGGVKIAVTGETRPLMVMADRDQIIQIFTNLVENAIKYGSPPGATVTIDLALTRLPIGNMVQVSIIDCGEGIEAHHIPRLTERFYRVDSHRSREKGGTGLGLAIVKYIVNRHRGRMKIESTLGQGSVFRVSLPYLR